MSETPGGTVGIPITGGVGVGLTIAEPLPATWLSLARYAQIMGFAFPPAIIGEAMGPVVAGAIYDTTATYTLAFVLVTVVSLLGLVCAVFLRRP